MDTTFYVGQTDQDEVGINFRIQVLDVGCRYLVIGPATVNIDGVDRNTVRVDRISGGGVKLSFDGVIQPEFMSAIVISGYLHTSIKKVDTLFFLEDTGLVAQNSSFLMEMSMAFSTGGMQTAAYERGELTYALSMDSCLVSAAVPKALAQADNAIREPETISSDIRNTKIVDRAMDAIYRAVDKYKDLKR